MRPSSHRQLSAFDLAMRREPLVLGYQGTLIPDPVHSMIASAGMDEVYFSPKLSVESWLENASRDLDLRLSAERCDGDGERFDHRVLLSALQERLTGILTQAMTVCPDATAEQAVHKFPVLSALLKAAIAEWVDAVAAFHRRLGRDASRLAAWLGYSKLPGLESLAPASSDQHAGGHTVIRLLFRDGRCIYYKPRAVTGEWLWDRLVQAVNAHSALQLLSARALSGANGRYGWVESLAPHDRLNDWRKTSAQAGRYWQAAGATLCLAGHVRMTDLHMANVMATSSGPALFDAESLGNPRAVCDTSIRHQAELPFATAIDDLLDTGLLPGQSSAGLPEISGLFGKAAPVPPFIIPRWFTCPAGERRLEMVPAALADQGNAPPHISPLEALPPMLSGYREAAIALMRCRENLLAPNSEWRWMLEHLHAPRIVLRDTLAYGILLNRSLRPEQLKFAQRRWTVVRRALGDAGDRNFSKAILRTEARDLLQLHIPRFVALPGSRTLAGSSGRLLVPRFLSSSPAEAVLRKLGELSPNQLSKIQIPSLLMVVLGQRS